MAFCPMDSLALNGLGAGMTRKTTPRPWIEERLRELQKTKIDLSRALGVSNARVYDLIAGTRRVQLGEVDRLARFLEWPSQVVINKIAGKSVAGSDIAPLDVELDYTPAFRDLPIFGAIDMGSGQFTLTERPVDHIDRSPSLRGNAEAYGFYCTQDTMSPAYDRGDTFIVDPTRPVAPGSDAVFVNDRGHRRVRRVVEITADGYKVQQFNPPKTQMMSAAEWKIVHKVFGSRRR